MKAAEALVDIQSASMLPIIADIHFHFQLALKAIENNVDQVRFNPGNIKESKNVARIVRAAKKKQIPLRIGVNAGSLAHARGNADLPLLMANTTMDQIRLLENLDFDLIEVSLKASDVLTNIAANKAIAEMTDYPIHIGVTEAGLPKTGSIKSAVGIGTLLYMGIGDSLRVSLTTPDPCEEVEAAYDILKSLNLRQRGPTIISCPTCGRCQIDNFSELVQSVEKRLANSEKTISVAVMGCVVNGPGEARDADVGLACGKTRGVIFKKGDKSGTVEESDFLEALMQEAEKD
jgi:(E)-4-hydroxy-3-methylbut-2-enyl-diphosphate synthase